MAATAVTSGRDLCTFMDGFCTTLATMDAARRESAMDIEKENSPASTLERFPP